MNRVFIVSGSMAYQMMFISNGFTVVEDIEFADLVCFTGGEDVTPALYGHDTHPQTYSSLRRDEKEKAIFDACRERNLPMVGICRGGQFLNVMSGGKMYQHVTNHTRQHYIEDIISGSHILVSSTHHQMMWPSDDAEPVAVAHNEGTREWMDGAIIKREPSNTDWEVVFYPSTKCLCFQPHPEFEGYYDMTTYFFSLIESKLKVRAFEDVPF
jgi:GMP synthase-like glutamine amidotransferase